MRKGHISPFFEFLFKDSGENKKPVNNMFTGFSVDLWDYNRTLKNH